jgi:osmotically-inducible protein OsmY
MTKIFHRSSVARPKAAMTLLVLAGLAATTLSGCVPVILAGGTSAGMGLASDRGLGTKIDDNGIQADISSRLYKHNVDLFNQVDLTVYKGQVLMNGSVPDEGARAKAEEIAWAAPGVQNVFNVLEVGPGQGTRDYAKDRWISTEIDANATFSKGINNLNFFVKTYNGVVYLLGTAESQSELDKMLTIARGTSGVKKVVQYVQVRPS